MDISFYISNVHHKECKESNPFQAKLNNTSVYCLNSKVHPDVMAVKGEKKLCKEG